MSIGRRDYILRMIEQFGAFLSRLAGLKTAGRTDEALALIEATLDELFGPMKRMLNDVDSATAANLLGNEEKTRMFARLMKEKGDVYQTKGEHAVARVAHRRALELYLESELSAAKSGSPSGDAKEAIAELREIVPLERLSPRHRTALESQTK